MTDLTQFDAKICYTAAGMLFRDGAVLMILHKKAGMWLPPGGHIEAGELPHQTAEREFLEETGVLVRAIDPYDALQGAGSTYLPNPVATNLHWINRATYEARKQGATITGKGCEQHVTFVYLVAAEDSLELIHNVEETDAIDWIDLSQLDAINTTDDIRSEIAYAHTLFSQT